MNISLPPEEKTYTELEALHDNITSDRNCRTISSGLGLTSLALTFQEALLELEFSEALEAIIALEGHPVGLTFGAIFSVAAVGFHLSSLGNAAALNELNTGQTPTGNEISDDLVSTDLSAHPK